MKLKFIGKGGMPNTFTDVDVVTVTNGHAAYVIQPKDEDQGEILEITIDGKMIVELDEQGVISVRQ